MGGGSSFEEWSEAREAETDERGRKRAEQTQPFTMDGSRWLWLARWGPAILTILAGLGLIIAFGQPQAEHTLFSRLVGAVPLALLSLSYLYQVGYLLVYTDRALTYDVKPFVVSHHSTDDFMETDPNRRGDRSRAYGRILVGLALAFVAASFAFVLLERALTATAAMTCVGC